MLSNSTLEIYNETKNQIPNLVFLEIKNDVLGKNFELQISILNPKNSKKINWKTRKQKYIPNTLSLKYSKNSGEIIFTPEIIKKETYILNNKSLSEFSDKFLFLFIHSLLHLKEKVHGFEMEKLEDKYFQKYKIN